MSKLSLSVALDPYEHALDLLTGRVAAEGIDLNWLRIPAAPVARRFADNREFDVAEVPLADILARYERGDRSILALPVFLCRQFVPGALWIRSGGAVRSLDDLRDPRLRWAVDDATLALYMRHWLKAVADFDAASDWVPLDTATLHAKLAAGELDVGVSLSRLTFAKGVAKGAAMGAMVARLIDDVSDAERRSYENTRVFPILRAVCIHRDLAERHPWLPASLFDAFDRAKRNSLDRLIGAGMSRYPLPWLNAYVLRIRTLFGDDIWPYGLAANRSTLEAFLEQAKHQGICGRARKLEDLFYGANER